MLKYDNQKHWATAPVFFLGMYLSALMWPIAATAQDLCEVPLFIKQNSATANVMILADNSGSMNTPIHHDDYDPHIIWPGRFNYSYTYYVASDRNYTPRSFNNYWESGPAVFLVSSDNGQSGRYEGNYLNWLFYNANDAQRASAPAVTRTQVLKVVLDQIVARSEQLNLGLTAFQSNSNGGNILGRCGSDHNTLRAQIAGMTANTWTPLGESLETILDYFGDKNNSPIENSCTNNFILVVTDGLPTMDVDVSGYLHDADGDGNDPGNCESIGAPYSNSSNCSDHMDDVAWWLANRDINPNVEGEQYAYTYVIGFNEDARLLRETARNGQGLFFQARNAVDLFTSIEYALQDILRRISAGSAVAVVSTERGTDDRLYRGKFMPVDWAGYLESYAAPYQTDDPALWEAGDLLRARDMGSRNIFTALGGNRLAFTTGNAGNLRDEMGAADDVEAAELIVWGRGNDVDGYRDRRGWVLGDIIHSSPVVVGPPSRYVLEESYQAFRQTHEYRQKLVYVGANDGMIHAFDAETGHEQWAFVPEFALPKFAAMADSFYCHTYSCDQTVAVKDMKVDGVWKTVLVAGGGRGGSGIFALDVTVPDSPSVLWQADLPNGKTNHSEVEMVSLAGTPVALVGSGVDVDNMEAFLYAYDLSAGNLLGSVLLSSDISALRNKASRPAVVDLNLDGQTDLVYVADMLGSVYRINVDSSPRPSRWDITELYRGNQEIQADPVAAFGQNGAIHVYFGTGAYLEDSDITSLGQNSFLCVLDRHDGHTATKSDLVDQTDNIDDMGNNDGWYVNLWNDDAERVTGRAEVVAETVIFTSFAPSDDVCVAGGSSWLYQMRYGNGGIPEVDYMDNEEDRSLVIGNGIASYPVVDLSAGTVVVQSSDASVNVQPIAAIFERLRVRSWQENYDLVAPVINGDMQ